MYSSVVQKRHSESLSHAGAKWRMVKPAIKTLHRKKGLILSHPWAGPQENPGTPAVRVIKANKDDHK